MDQFDWYKWRRAHLRWFAEAGIKDTADYLRIFGSDEFSKNIEEDQKEKINEINLHGFERGSSNEDQKIAIVGINPKLSLSPSEDISQNTNYQLGDVDVDDTELSQKEGPEKGLKWLITQSNENVANYVDSIFEKLAEKGLLPSELSPPKEDDIPELIDNIYYTNWFKYATLNEKKIEDWVDSDGKSGVDQISDSEIKNYFITNIAKATWFRIPC